MIINDIITLQVLAAQCPSAALFDTDYYAVYGKYVPSQVGYYCASCAARIELRRARDRTQRHSASGWELRPNNDNKTTCNYCSYVCYTSAELCDKFTMP